MSEGRDEAAAEAPPEPPPFFGRWSRVYLLVLVSQALIVGLLALFGALAS